jgi:tetraacyldisaccharide 4'-kinase
MCGVLNNRLLAPLGWLYGLGATVHGRLRTARPYYPAVPTISVGNLTVGGTGKTLVAEWLAAHFARQGHQVAILSRGYGGSITQPVRVDLNVHKASEVGDEPLALAGAFPNLPVHVWTGRNRARVAQRAEAAGATLLILDDGFQRQDVVRQVNILCLDPARGFGNGLCLPAGPLREPLSARKRAHFAILVSEAAQPETPAWQGLPAYRLTVATPLPNSLKNKPLIAFAGLGRPSKFFGALTASGASLAATQAYPDHHAYTSADITHLKNLARRHNAMLVTTPKDAPKLPAGFATVLAPRLTGPDKENILADITTRLA